MTKPWEVKPYDCPHCGATDSSATCRFMVTIDYHRQVGYPRRNEVKAREAGCRAIYYHDLAVGDQRENDDRQ